MKNKITYKIFLGLFIASFLPFCFGGIIWYFHTKQAEQKKLIAFSENFIQEVMPDLEAACASFEPQAVMPLTFLLRLHPAVIEFLVHSDEYDMPLAFLTLPERKKGTIFTIEKTLFHKQKQIGKIHLLISSYASDQELLKKTKQLFLIFLIIYFISIIIIMLFISRLINKPIHKLLFEINQINNGELDTPFIWKGENEFAHLGQAIEKIREKFFFVFRTLHDKTTKDPLTKISNRKEFLDKALSAFQICQQQHIPFSLIMIDIDHFKQINKKHGYDIGDEILQNIADNLQRHTRDEDMIARWDSEEFILALPKTSSTQIISIAQKLHQTLTTAQYTNEIKIEASFGIAQDNGKYTLFELLQYAKEALKYAKKLGGNKIKTYADLQNLTKKEPDKLIEQ